MKAVDDQHIVRGEFQSSINYSVIAKDIEMDAILAVALGVHAVSYVLEVG